VQHIDDMLYEVKHPMIVGCKDNVFVIAGNPEQWMQYYSLVECDWEMIKSPVPQNLLHRAPPISICLNNRYLLLFGLAWKQNEITIGMFEPDKQGERVWSV